MATAPATFKTMLRKSMDDIKKPEPIPEGTYLGRIKGHSFEESSQKKTPFVRFNVIPHEPQAGVDTDDLAVALQGQPLSTKKLRMDYYMTEEALFRFKDLCTSLGIDTSGRSIEECVQETEGKEVLIDVIRAPSQDGESFYNNIKLMRGTAD
jgi:hypothetical protein